MQVVVADDDLGERLVLKTVLSRLNYEVEATEDGAAALEALERGSASILLTDITMPEMDGLELVRRLRETDLGRYIYVIVFTGLGASEARMRGLEAGADEFMSKPIDTASLVARLRAAERLMTYERDLRAKNQRLQEANRIIKDDLDAAASAQRALLPDPDVRICGCRFSSVFLPSRAVSGDVFNHFRIGEGRVGFFGADVSGHGVRAALAAVALGYMASEEFFTNMAVRRDDGTLQPKRVADVLNARFFREGAETYFTLFVGTIDERLDRLVYCQAGYPSPLLLGSNGRARFVGEGGMPVALLSDAIFDEGSIGFAPGDRLVVYSDGVTEAANASGEPFGAERLASSMRDMRGDLPQVALDHLTRQLAAWTEGEPLEDDVSLIIIDRENPQ
ncbi:PP2C family protein-serine/threonine phosphatase [Devosia nitrariae]|uniref:Fused response regulator/phosphatase n=1 Tax=Devosia nitrariae TaxID=2071872 RepID=A0ABQ5WBZ7_9HYPH|nr:SpoIIE family protein phosphatase [Devosia nitrariae]GLQ57040.1 fused response regulator/phosphatase [Devosia nitrariae]